jgi:hypothetical protein
VLLFWGFAAVRLVPGAAFVLASVFATVITWGADRMMVSSPRARRVLPFLGLAAVVAWSVIPYFLAVADA